MLCSYIGAGRPLQPAWAVQEVFHAVYIVFLNKLEMKHIGKNNFDTVAAGRPAEPALPVQEVYHVVAGRCNGFLLSRSNGALAVKKNT